MLVHNRIPGFTPETMAWQGHPWMPTQPSWALMHAGASIT